MENFQVPPREDIPLEHRWNDTSLFPNAKAWSKEYEAIVVVLGTFKKETANFNTSAADLAATLDAVLPVDSARRAACSAR